MQQNDIWIRFINGDNTCFSVIYKQYIDILFRYGMQFTSNEEIVKDAIHDIFIRIYKNRSQLNSDIHVKFYLLKALKNYLYNIFKKNTAFEKINESDFNIIDLEAEEKILLNLEIEEERRIITNLLKKLTDHQREIIYYRFVEELSMKEIGTLMNMNTQSVQNIIQRSLKKMRETQILPLKSHRSPPTELYTEQPA